MLRLKEAIVVEGRYDKITLETLVDTAIFTTDGFGIFRDAQKMELLRRVARKRGLIVLTDSDGAGLLIRNRLRSSIGDEFLKHAYIPQICGKEKRKKTPSRENTLGVEGMKPSVLEEILRRAGAQTDRPRETAPLTKADLFKNGLSGTNDAARRRLALQRHLGLPDNISANALLQALNCLYSREEVLSALYSLQEHGGEIPDDDDAGGV